MIRIYALVLIAVFASLLVKPVIPYLEYLTRKNFIIENLCINREKPETTCNGKCHLKKQIQKESENSTKQPFRPLQEQNEITDYVIWGTVDGEIQSQVRLIRPFHREIYSFQFSKKIFHPPI